LILSKIRYKNPNHDVTAKNKYKSRKADINLVIVALESSEV